MIKPCYMKTTKILIGIVAITLSFTSCFTVKQIGQLTMISNRNIDHNQNYELLRGYVGSTDAERKKSRATTLQQAIDEAVQKVPGGEYMMNVRMYEILYGKKRQYYSVDGDVWGIKQNSSEQTSAAGGTYYSFKEGDNVTWKKGSKYYTGVIISMKDKKKCLIKTDQTGDVINEDYEDISKIATPQQINPSPVSQNVPSNEQAAQSAVQIQIGDKVMWQDTSDKKFYPGVVVGQGNGVWLIKDDDDSKTYPVNTSQVYLSK